MPYYVYLLASRKHGTLYLGVTNDIGRRVYQHKTKAFVGFTSRYGVDKLMWFEVYDQIEDAIAREKALKKWRRRWKCDLIEGINSEWSDLYETLNHDCHSGRRSRTRNPLRSQKMSRTGARNVFRVLGSRRAPG